MKTKLIVVLTVLASTQVFTILPSKARAPKPDSPQGCDVYVVFDRNDTYVNLRDSPNGQILQKIPNGTKAAVDSSRAIGDWSFTSFAKTSSPGYIKSNLLRQDSTHYVFDPQDTFVNLRSAPNGQILRKVTNGTPVTILPNTEANGWVKVRLNIDNQPFGYMSSNRISAPSCN